MKLYFIGVAICTTIGFLRLIFILISIIPSVRLKNFRKVGLYFDPKTEEISSFKPTWTRWVLYIAELLIITPLFRWLSIAIDLYVLLNVYVNRFSMDDELKEIEYKLSTSDLAKDQIMELISELNEFYYYVDAQNNLKERSYLFQPFIYPRKSSLKA